MYLILSPLYKLSNTSRTTRFNFSTLSVQTVATARQLCNGSTNFIHYNTVRNGSSKRKCYKKKFTMLFFNRTKKNNSFNFVDLRIIRDTTNKLKTNWYTKPTSSVWYVTYNSNHPKNQNIIVIMGLTDRAFALTPSEYRMEALKIIQRYCAK